MSEQNEHIEYLQAVRDYLVELRRSRAKFGALNDGHENAAAHIVILQEQIRAIDEALNDEAKLVGSPYEERGLLTV